MNILICFVLTRNKIRIIITINLGGALHPAGCQYQARNYKCDYGSHIKYLLQRQLSYLCKLEITKNIPQLWPLKK